MCVLTQFKLKNSALAFGKILIIYEETHKAHIISSNHDTEMRISQPWNTRSIITSTLLLNLLPWPPSSFEYTNRYFLYKAAHEEVLLRKYSYTNYFMNLNHHLRLRKKWSFINKLDWNALNYYYYITILHYKTIY